MQFTIKFQAAHLVAVLEAVRREIATPRDMQPVLWNVGPIDDEYEALERELRGKGLID